MTAIAPIPTGETPAPESAQPPNPATAAPTPTSEPTDAPVLTCRGLQKRFGDRQSPSTASASRSARGETYGLLGPNGAGKTTTISMICGLLARDGGEVVVDGRADRSGSDGRQGRYRLRPAGPRDLPGPDRPREPALLRPALRAAAAGRCASRVDELLEVIGLTDRAEGPDRAVLGRDEAPAQHRHRPAPPAAAARARRADRRRRPAEPERDPGERRRSSAAEGMADPLHDPLHGGGRAPLRPRRDHRRGADPRRGDAPRAGRSRRRSATGSA